MSAQTLERLEERLATVEAEIAELKRSKEPDKKEPDKSDEDIPWWKKMVGTYADCPEFEEAVKFGRDWRESEDEDLPNEGAA